jgi:carboxymethylenebutenolidase
MMIIETRDTSFQCGDHLTPGYLAQPTGVGPHPGLIIIQEWWGLVPHIKEVARRFAAQGYVALAPDLYYGEAAAEPDEARKLSMALDRQQAVAEILAAAEHLSGLQRVRPRGVGVVGWCMGGGLALSAASEGINLAAAVCFYGRPLSAGDVALLKVPVLGLYGSEDRGIPVSAVRSFESDLQAHGVPHEIHIYEGAGHAFFNDTRAAYHPQAAADAWSRALAWFEQHLT